MGQYGDFFSHYYSRFKEINKVLSEIIRDTIQFIQYYERRNSFYLLRLRRALDIQSCKIRRPWRFEGTIVARYDRGIFL